MRTAVTIVDPKNPHAYMMPQILSESTILNPKRSSVIEIINEMKNNAQQPLTCFTIVLATSVRE